MKFIVLWDLKSSNVLTSITYSGTLMCWISWDVYSYETFAIYSYQEPDTDKGEEYLGNNCQTCLNRLLKLTYGLAHFLLFLPITPNCLCNKVIQQLASCDLGTDFSNQIITEIQSSITITGRKKPDKISVGTKSKSN